MNSRNRCKADTKLLRKKGNSSIADQDHLDTEVAKILAARNSPDKIDLAGKISTESKALIDPFLDQLSKDLTEDESQGPTHLAVIVYNLWEQNLSEDIQR